MSSAHTSLDQLVHLRILLGVLVGLSITRLLTGLAHFVQHPRYHHLYSPHLAWTLFIFLTVIHFWWFEFNLSYTKVWTFNYYLFLITYASTFFFISTLLFPDSLLEYKNYESYFHARQHWFYGLLIFCFIIDFADSYLKGIEYFRALGAEYILRQSAMISVSAIAIFIRNKTFHLTFALVSIAILLIWVINRYQQLG